MKNLKKVKKDSEKILQDLKKGKAKKTLIPVLLAIILVFSAINFKHVFIAAMVNGKIITRFALDRELEKASGKDTLEGLITKNLILQEAKALNVAPTKEEISKKINDIRAQLEPQGTTLEDALLAQGRNLSDLEEQLVIQVIVEKILGKDLEVTDEQVKAYFEENASFFPEEATLESETQAIKDQLFQQALGQEFQPWLEGLKAKSKLKYFLKF